MIFEGKEFWDIEEAGEYLQASRVLIFKLCRQGKLHRAGKLHRKVYFLADEVKNYRRSLLNGDINETNRNQPA